MSAPLIRRVDRGALAEWWMTLDRGLLLTFAALLWIGIFAGLVAEPSAAERLGLPRWHFFERRLFHASAALFVMFGLSMLGDKGLRRWALGLLIASLASAVLAMTLGDEVKGARRWLDLGAFSIQPSEFLKPSFAILCAWSFAKSVERRGAPENLSASALLALALSVLIAQPDFGQAALLAAAWGLTLFAVGLPWLTAFSLLGAFSAASAAAYFGAAHVASRVDRFLNPASGDTYQTDRALEAFVNGGVFGQGAGGGDVKRQLPDAHSDFIFAAFSEEFGALAALVPLSLFALAVARTLRAAERETDPFRRSALFFLGSLFGLQTLINVGVNVGLLPAKGMTLPFVSYGGSSMLATAFLAGAILSLARRRAPKELLRESES